MTRVLDTRTEPPAREMSAMMDGPMWPRRVVSSYCTDGGCPLSGMANAIGSKGN